MPFESALKTLLGAASISAIAEDRVHPQILPEGSTKPAITYSIYNDDDQLDLDNDDGNLRPISGQIDCWAPSYDRAVALTEALRALMKGATIAANSFRLGAFSSRDDYDSDTKLHRKINDFTVWYRSS